MNVYVKFILLFTKVIIAIEVWGKIASAVVWVKGLAPRLQVQYDHEVLAKLI